MSDLKRALLSQVVGREVLCRAAEVLSPAGIPVMPLKGVWLQGYVYPAHESRVITDVDVIVPEPVFGTALDRFAQAGWRVRSADVRQVALQHPDLALPLDLHRLLFTRGAFALPTPALFRRARLDRTGFGVDLWLPDPRDGFAHLVGHFIKSRIDPCNPVRLADFEAIARRFELDPRDCAAHLHAVGMARAARYVLHELARKAAFFDELLDSLPYDLLAAPLVRAARTAAAHSPRIPSAGALPGFLLDRTLASGARAALLRAIDLRQERTPESASSV